MRNLYSVTKGQQAIRDLVKAIRDVTGNMPTLPAKNQRAAAPQFQQDSYGNAVVPFQRSKIGASFSQSNSRRPYEARNNCNLRFTSSLQRILCPTRAAPRAAPRTGGISS
jgi:hypothetical protein